MFWISIYFDFAASRRALQAQNGPATWRVSANKIALLTNLHEKQMILSSISFSIFWSSVLSIHIYLIAHTKIYIFNVFV